MSVCRQRSLDINDENMNNGIVAQQNEAFLDSDTEVQISVSTIVINLFRKLKMCMVACW